MSPRPTADQLRELTRLLEALVEDRGALAELSVEDRQRLLVAAGRVSRPERHEQVRLAKTFRARDRQRREAADREKLDATEIRSARERAVFAWNPSPEPRPQAQGEGPELATPRDCYVCKQSYRRLHFFYDALCPSCGDFNYDKRFFSCDLSGRTALITGARVKIGFFAALKLLRAGARVIVTTRFPHDAARRYASESDFAQWRTRLEVHGLDLRHAPSVERFALWLRDREPRLDFVLNNAAQTVRRPSGYYAHLLEHEARPRSELRPEERELLSARAELLSALGAGKTAQDAIDLAHTLRAPGIEGSAALSQVPVSFEDLHSDGGLFPVGRLDADLQQVDLRRTNSWRMSLAEVSAPELLEVHLVNAIAPFILVARLRPLLARDPSFDKQVVNVSAMEGSFSRGTKTDKHPHTNMAKAALNMLTLTSAPDLAKDGIFMNAVDTGWVTDEDPELHSTRKRQELGFQPPLDVVDGAARIVDPIFMGVSRREQWVGRFLKDYHPTSW